MHELIPITGMLNKQNKILLLYKFFLFCFNILLSFIFGRSYLVEMSIAII